MKRLLYVGLFLLFVTVALLLARPSPSCYAPPRTADTVPPFVEPTLAEAPTDSQSEVFKDAGGWVNQREHPLSSNFQSNAYTGSEYGSFGPYVSNIGTILSENYSGPSVSDTPNGITETPESNNIVLAESESNVVLAASESNVMTRSETFIPFNQGFGTEVTFQEQSGSSTSQASDQTQTQ